jgi:hypothetical protein
MSLEKLIKPLRELHFPYIQVPLDGLLRNMDSDLQRRCKEVQASNNFEVFRQSTLLLVMLRFGINSYQALAFLLSDVEEHTKRLARYVLVVPPVNRQIMDLWFTLAYMMDDFGSRSHLYEQCAYRELRIHVEENKLRYGADPEWRGWFEDMQELSDMMESQISVTLEQKTNPKSIPSWPHPHALTEKQTKSQEFLKLLHELLYSDTSIEAHLKPSGLMTAAGLLLSDIGPEHLRKKIEDRTIHQYKFHHYSRTVITVLGIVSEIEMHLNLNNKEQIAKVWRRIAEYSPDAKEIYEARYKSHFG